MIGSPPLLYAGIHAFFSRHSDIPTAPEETILYFFCLGVSLAWLVTLRTVWTLYLPIGPFYPSAQSLFLTRCSLCTLRMVIISYYGNFLVPCLSPQPDNASFTSDYSLTLGNITQVLNKCLKN